MMGDVSPETIRDQFKWNIYLIVASSWSSHFIIVWCTVTWNWKWYFCLNELCYSEHYVEGTSQEVDSGIAVWMKCGTVNIMWKVLHSRWKVVLLFEWSVLQGKLLEVPSQQVDSGIAVWMNCVTVNIMWKVIHSRWTVVLLFEWSVLQWILGEILGNKYRKYYLIQSLHWAMSLAKYCAIRT